MGRARLSEYRHGVIEGMSERVTRLRAAVVCVDDGALLCVRLCDPVTNVVRLFPPGGGIEPGESAAQAAVREAREETGYAVTLLPGGERVARYEFTWGGVPVDVTSHFFAAVLTEGRHAQGPYERNAMHLAVEWAACSELDQTLGYDASIRNHVQELVRWTEQHGREGRR
jgi:8-oxo-dGTP pyrophosphatase MutT (NUDIX family)